MKIVPSRRPRPDRDRLLARLPPIEHHPRAEEERLLEQSGLARVLPLLAGVDQEAEYRLCRELAEHLLGEVPEPPEVTSES